MYTAGRGMPRNILRVYCGFILDNFGAVQRQQHQTNAALHKTIVERCCRFQRSEAPCPPPGVLAYGPCRPAGYTKVCSLRPVGYQIQRLGRPKRGAFVGHIMSSPSRSSGVSTLFNNVCKMIPGPRGGLPRPKFNSRGIE